MRSAPRASAAAMRVVSWREPSRKMISSSHSGRPTLPRARTASASMRPSSASRQGIRRAEDRGSQKLPRAEIALALIAWFGSVMPAATIAKVSGTARAPRTSNEATLISGSGLPAQYVSAGSTLSPPISPRAKIALIFSGSDPRLRRSSSSDRLPRASIRSSERAAASRTPGLGSWSRAARAARRRDVEACGIMFPL